MEKNKVKINKQVQANTTPTNNQTKQKQDRNRLSQKKKATQTKQEKPLLQIFFAKKPYLATLKSEYHLAVRPSLMYLV